MSAILKTRKFKKQVVIIVPSFPKLSETFIANNVLELLKQGWDVQIVCGSSEVTEWAHTPQLHSEANIRQRVHVVWPHRPRWLAGLLIPVALARCFFQNPRNTWLYLKRGWREVGYSVFRLLYLDADLIALKPNLIHFEFGSLAVGRMHLRDWLETKIIVSFRGYDLNYIGLDQPNYYQQVWEKADAIHLLGQDLWTQAVKRGCPKDKLHQLIPPAIDTKFFDPGSRHHINMVGTPENPLRILSVGRLDWQKGYEYGLHAIKHLVDQGLFCQYRIIGDGPYFEALSFARYQFGLENIVEFMGAQPASKIKTQMLWADVFLHAAVSEGFCNAVLEAQSMALPVVCTDAGGLPENVVDQVTGFIVPRRDAQALAEKLALLIFPEHRQKMGRAGRQRVLKHFQLQKQISDFEQFYQQVLAN